MELFKPGLDMIQPEWTDATRPANVDAIFTCRDGGVSSGPWGNADGLMGLNVGMNTGDAAACVRMNRGIVAQLVPTDPVWLNQVHGTTLVDAAAVEQTPDADASMTTKPGVVCTVMVADCLPVLIADKKGRAVAAVHAGWKSLAAGIIQKTVKAMRETVGEDFDATVWLAPRIGADDFEVGQDVLDAMTAQLPDAKQAFVPAENDRYKADLAALAVQALTAAGVPAGQIVDCGLSTFADGKRFYSYRRDGERSGRHAAMIWIKPQD